ncbi:MAG: hypothetical protein QOC55_439 [Thermoleophilaceae bacterium]|jgi:glycosyltransferase involved in cell wall biosynthesis|nr:hypothetical protein [Thermoleophilaceae bacterium]
MGGAELALQRIAQRLPAHGFDVSVVTPRELPLGGIQRGGWPRAVASWPRARRLAARSDVVLLNGIVTQRLAPAMTAATLVPYIHELSDSAPRAWRSARFWRSAPLVLCACAAVAQRCRAFGAPGDRLRVVYAPVEEVARAPRPAWAGHGPVVGFVGRIELHKGTLDLVRAMRAVDARLVVIGEGAGAYAEQVRAEGDGVIFAGAVEDAGPLMAWFDLLAVPSRSEAFGTVAAEALAAGTPVVATRSGGVEEYVVPGRNGDLVMPGDVDALAEAIRRLLPRAASMAEAAREDARRFDADVVAADVADAIGKALARRGR